MLQFAGLPHRQPGGSEAATECNESGVTQNLQPPVLQQVASSTDLLDGVQVNVVILKVWIYLSFLSSFFPFHLFAMAGVHEVVYTGNEKKKKKRKDKRRGCWSFGPLQPVANFLAKYSEQRVLIAAT